MFDVTLSFDNGPDPDVTAQVLNELEMRGLRSTFFIIGSKLAEPRARSAIMRAHEDGHWIGNHTWSHASPLGRRIEPDIAEQEIGRTQDEIAAAGLAHPDRLFRPVGGGGALGPHLLNQRCADYLCAGGFTCVLWNSIPRDWVDPDGWVERAVAHCKAQPWTLTVLHDLPTGAMRQLPRFLDAVLRIGGRFRQDFPPDCLPLLRGRPDVQLGEYVSSNAR